MATKHPVVLSTIQVYLYDAIVFSVTSISGAVVAVIGELMVTVDVIADPRVLMLVKKEVAEDGTRPVDSGEVTCTCACECGIVLSKT